MLLSADVSAHLPDRLEEGQALDVADGPADLDDDHVGAGLLGDPVDPLLDLVGDVGDDLDGSAQVVALPLAADHVLVDLARGDVARPGEAHVDEPLVVAQVQIRLGAVVGDEHLSVLEGLIVPGSTFR